MALATKVSPARLERAKGHIVISPEHERYYEILDQLQDKYPDDDELLDELSGLVCDLMDESELTGVHRHGIQILQMINGDRYQHQACMPPEVDTDGDEDRWYEAGTRTAVKS
jgi:hypothetical protein